MPDIPVEILRAQEKGERIIVALLPYRSFTEQEIRLSQARLIAELAEKSESLPTVPICIVSSSALQICALHPAVGKGLSLPITVACGLWVPETLYASCDLLILVDQTAEPVVSTDVVDHGGGAVRKGP